MDSSLDSKPVIIDGIRRGLADVAAGHLVDNETAFAELRRQLTLAVIVGGSFSIGIAKERIASGGQGLRPLSFSFVLAAGVSACAKIALAHCFRYILGRWISAKSL